ncbi:helix-turn-helix transcriptional regulator [Maritimibacter sp. DP1N21-5]|uniref:helix-turn-helix domain-containing protein n=1 Tax=Maritimibacter sp. DP1N21-5 TaxID=2836867 RepID=UPI002102204C|nr:helix-turn-helix transcriptional regulator [Maritimibacter sp. DP1N21-5]
MRSFRESFIRRLDETGATVAEVADTIGVSRHQLYKLTHRKVESTNADDAVKIAAYFGMSVEEFMSDERASLSDFALLFAKLTPEEQAMVVAQLRGLVGMRGPSA